MTIKTDRAIESLAGRIAIRFIREYRTQIHFPEKTGPSSASDPHNAKWLDRRVQEDAPKLAEMIADELSAHEQKVRELVEAAKAAISAGTKEKAGAHWFESNAMPSKTTQVIVRLRAALKALEEQPNGM